MNWPTHRIVRCPARDRERLAAWLAERTLDLTLRNPGPDTEHPLQRAPLQYRSTAEVNAVHAGAVYILRPPPPLAAPELGPVYVLVLENDIPAQLEAIPFSRYATPAVPGEWQTGLRAGLLRTLCFWNSRHIRNNHLLPGHICRLAVKKLEEVRQCFRHVLFNEPVAARLLRGFGPPLRHPADPRYAYLDEERQRVDLHLLESVLAAGTPSPPAEIAYLPRTAGRPTWLMAAEGRCDYGADKM